MSHYTVGVILPKEVLEEDLNEYLSKALAPFDEHIEVEPYIRYTKEELLVQYENYKKRELKRHQDKNFNETFSMIKGDMEIPDLEVRSFEDFVTIYMGYDIDKDFNALSTYNPNSKWDSYKIGGRWYSSVKLKDGSYCDYARIKDIVFEEEFSEEELIAMKESYKIAITEGDFFVPEYNKKRYPTFEIYLKNRNFTTYALLDEKGNWLEPGQMGSFGISASTYGEEIEFTDKYLDIIKSHNEDNWFVLVDCHI